MSDTEQSTDEIMRERLQALLDRRGLSPRALSLAIDANHSYVSQLLNGRGGSPSAARLARLAAELGTTTEYLTGATDSPDQVRSEVSLGDARLDWRGSSPDLPGIPLVGTGDCADIELSAEGGEMVAIERSTFDPDYHVRLIARPPALAGARDIYAIYFHGESMEPRFEAGEIGIVDPGRPVRSGDYVVVQLRENGGKEVTSVLVKRLLRTTGDVYHLEQFNPRLAFTVPKSRVARIHRIMRQTDFLF
ncbi:S24 family peptidase [Tsuneonella sp. HG222]